MSKARFQIDGWMDEGAENEKAAQEKKGSKCPLLPRGARSTSERVADAEVVAGGGARQARVARARAA
ncbi:hypothetical protein, partial [uncultured Variovorax sp.]|uniref:hypothetical protein n=1 Tax=uncultured Variovorax sp. TaxID=114708 RepID=UPI002623045D